MGCGYIFWGATLQPPMAHLKEKKQARTPRTGAAPRAGPLMPQDCRESHSGRREGGSGCFYFLWMLLLHHGFISPGFSKVCIECSRQSRLCGEERGSWARVAEGAQLTWGQGSFRSQPGRDDVGGTRTSEAPPSRLQALGQSGFCSVQEGDVVYTRSW